MMRYLYSTIRGFLINQTPLEIPESFRQKIQQHLSKAQIVEISATIAMENLRSRFYHTVGLESQGFTQEGFCVLSARRDGDRIMM